LGGWGTRFRPRDIGLTRCGAIEDYSKEKFSLRFYPQDTQLNSSKIPKLKILFLS